MLRWWFALMLVAVVFAQARAQETPKKTYGSAFLDAYFEPNGVIRDAIKLRFKCHVAENTCWRRGNQQVWKIIFMNHFLAGDAGQRWREFESNVYSWRFTYPHLTRMVPGQPSARRDIQGESSIFLSISDNYRDRRIGARSRDQAMFPTMDQEIDAIKDFWKREQVSQEDLTGKTLAVEVTRGPIAADSSNWSVHGALPADQYRIWTMTVSWGGRSHAVDVVMPDSGARFYRPGTPVRIATEAFFVNPGLLRVFYWDFEIQRVNQSSRYPLRKWKLVNTDARPGDNTWGMKLAMFQGRPAIEVSNDGTRTYMQKGDIIELK
ncbi:MAG: hypothetical protein JW741_21410 [Sedimentisphaerales bacterium]|nr:hypothetical protein [Sedimentisphaerales bacterium]